jgi:hypothetical protein
MSSVRWRIPGEITSKTARPELVLGNFEALSLAGRLFVAESFNVEEHIQQGCLP